MVNKDGTIEHIKYIAGQRYRVIITYLGTRGVWNAVDVIKNENTGTIKRMKRKEWYDIFKKYK